MGPSVHVPSWVLKPSNGTSQNLNEANSENVLPMTYPDSYKAWTVQTGIGYDFYVTKQLGNWNQWRCKTSSRW